MAVFTEVSFEEANTFLAPFQVGELVELKGITAGIENTNYFASTTQGEFVLTLFERLSTQELPFYLELMRHLAQKGVKVPEPQAHRTGKQQGALLHHLNSKPAALVNRLQGESQLAPLPHHCAQMGAEMARMHLAGQDFTIHQPNLRNLHWWEETIPQVLPFLTAEQKELITSELATHQKLSKTQTYQALPQGTTHTDLFRNNVMFAGEAMANQTLSGIFDFYFAGIDTFLFDIAVCINDWCIDLETGVIDPARAKALLDAYQQQRALTVEEQELLPLMLRAGAMRYWTSRLWDLHLPREAQLLVPHDPMHFERILRERIEHPYQIEP